MKKWYGSYDLDGCYEIVYTEKENYKPFSHMLGPHDSFDEIKKDIIAGFKFCINELKLGIDDVKKTKKKEII